MSMSEESTRELPDRGSFEQRVFARFDLIDRRLEKLESRNYDTRPVWEKALKAIMELGLEMGEVKTKVGAIEAKVDAVEAKVGEVQIRTGAIETRLGTIEGQVADFRTDYAGLNKKLIDTQLDFNLNLTRRMELVLTTLVDNREGLRAAEERLTQLESKLA